MNILRNNIKTQILRKQLRKRYRDLAHCYMDGEITNNRYPEVPIMKNQRFLSYAKYNIETLKIIRDLQPEDVHLEMKNKLLELLPRTQRYINMSIVSEVCLHFGLIGYENLRQIFHNVESIEAYAYFSNSFIFPNLKNSEFLQNSVSIIEVINK